MAGLLNPGEAGQGSTRAVEVLFIAARRLEYDECACLHQRLGEHLILLAQEHALDLSPNAGRRARLISGMRAAAEALGHPASTSEHVAENRRRAALGHPRLPSTATIIREFGTWAGAQAAAGLLPQAPPNALQRRRDRLQHVVHRYSQQRMSECLQACARDLQRIPMVRDYVIWREAVLASAGPGRSVNDVPHYRTYYCRYGTWDDALLAAGLDPFRPSRTETTRYSELPEHGDMVGESGG